MRGRAARLVERLEQTDARLWAVAASLLLSAWAGLGVQVPNDDAFVYIRTARIFLDEGIEAAFGHYAWAGYPVLLGLVGSLGPGPFAAAYLLNALFFALLAFAFVSICREFSTDRRLLALAALTILLFPEINEYRYLILRDTGFWAFSLLGLWCLIAYGAEGSWKYCLFFAAAMVFATLFRPEAALYLLLAPLCLLFDQRYPRAERFLLRFRMLAAALGALLLCLLGGLAFGLNLFHQMIESASTYLPFVQSLFDPVSREAAAEAIFGGHAATWSGRYLPLFLVAGLLAILVVELFYAVGMPFTLILAWGYWKRWLLPDRNATLPIIAFALINLLTVLGFILLTRYLTSRYAMMFSLSLAVFVPFIARQMLARALPGSRAAVWLLVLFFSFSAVDSFYSFGRSKAHVGDAIAWLDANHDGAAALITNVRAVAYFSGLVPEYDQVQPQLAEERILAAESGDLVVVETSVALGQLRNQAEVSALLEPVVAYPETGAPSIFIYRRR